MTATTLGLNAGATLRCKIKTTQGPDPAVVKALKADLEAIAKTAKSCVFIGMGLPETKVPVAPLAGPTTVTRSTRALRKIVQRSFNRPRSPAMAGDVRAAGRLLGARRRPRKVGIRPGRR